MKILKSKKKKLALTLLIVQVKKCHWVTHENLFAQTSQDIISHTRENSKMFNITSKYFSIFNNPSLAKQELLTYFSCSYYSFMAILTNPKFFTQTWHSLDVHFHILYLDRNSLFDSVFLIPFGIEFHIKAHKYLSEFFPLRTVLTFAIINSCSERRK